MGKLSRAGVNINKINVELKSAAYDIGIEIIEELAERVAEEASKNAVKLQDIEKEYDIVTNKSKKLTGRTAKIKNRRGPDKHGRSTSGPIKDNIVVLPSKKVPLSRLVDSTAWYSHFIEFGTDPHPIKPKKGKKEMLFPVSGTTAVFAKNVNHPGMKAKPFLRPAADKAEDFLREILIENGIDK